MRIWNRRMLADALVPRGALDWVVLIVSSLIGLLFMLIVSMEGSFWQVAALVLVVWLVTWTQGPQWGTFGAEERAGFVAGFAMATLMTIGLLVGRPIASVIG